MDEFAVQRVLLAVDQVPPGWVASYGDIGAVVGVGPRQVGAILREHGDQVAWWRVVSAAGTLPAPLAGRAAAHWDAEGVAHADGRVDLSGHRVDRVALAAAYARAV
nr:cysteine methyltransferase [Propionibacterium sp.]